MGLWLFSDPARLEAASIGPDLQPFGTDIIPISGVSATDGAVLIHPGSYYLAPLMLASNGGGAFVNDYSIVCDFEAFSLDTSHAFYNASEDNSDGAELLLNGLNGSLRLPGYRSSRAGVIEADTWYRLVVTFGSVSGARVYRAYLDGVLIDTQTNIQVDSRYSLCTEGTVFFGDAEGQDGPITVSTLALYDRALTPSEVGEIGGVKDKIVTSAPVSVLGVIHSRPSPEYCTEDIRIDLIAPEGWPCYQWYFEDVPLTDSARIQGSNERIISFIPAALHDSGIYSCRCELASKAGTTTYPYLFAVRPKHEIAASTSLGLMVLAGAIAFSAVFFLRRPRHT